ncbi:zinc finger protein 502-like isoform X2 [Melanotaenia boesemani]|uniref:zinc finger protein 502-like isoform X2 n=1 Tax=Melanotaenia boesemani TaxID=1250792 RepID=UPI001C03C1A6|nr:zinc finger protein 502-like isoform X2 [Melanotaenia boesemani]
METDVTVMDGNTAQSLSEMSKAEKLRGFVTETLAAASREILTLFDTVVAAYEEEASGFRREIDWQRRQLELLQPQVTVSAAGVKSSRNQGSVEEEESNELLKSLVSTAPSRSLVPRRQHARRKPCRPQISKMHNTLNFKICILEDPQIKVLTKNVKTCPILNLKCPRDLQEADFLDLLRSAVPQLAGHGRAFDFLTLDKRRRLKPLKLKTMTAEEIYNNMSCTGLSRPTLHIRLKTQEEPREATVPQTETSSSVMSTCEKTKQQSSSAQAAEGSRLDDMSIGSVSHQQEAGDEDRGMLDPDEDSLLHAEENLDGEESDSSWKPERRKTDSKPQPELTEKQKVTLPVSFPAGNSIAAFPCKVCGAPNRSEVALVKHAWTHGDEAGGVCGVCGESVEGLKDHLESRHKTKDCHLCGESFLCSLSLNEHVAGHSGQRPFKCSVCHGEFALEETLEDHQKLHEPGHRCQICRKVFELEEQLKAHSRTHTSSKTYLCGVCGKFLRDNRSLSRHKKTHSVERPHGCQVCGRSFKLPTTLKQHEKIHTDRERSYLCDVCCKMFLTSKQLLIHMRTHTNEKPYHCDECGKGFTTKGPLTIHMRVHTGETPYRCAHCGWSFKRKTHLDNHVAIHTGAKPYVCGICGKTCARKTYLTVHMRTHNGERPYKCSACDKAFTQSHCLKSHMKSHRAATAAP